MRIRRRGEGWAVAAALGALALFGACDELDDDGGNADAPPAAEAAACDVPEVACSGDYYVGECPVWRAGGCPRFHPTGELRNCTRITGELSIHRVRDARVSLPNLREIDGDFHVTENGALSDLDLPCLRQVGDWFWIEDNPALSACAVQDMIGRLQGRPSRVCAGGNLQGACPEDGAGCT